MFETKEKKQTIINWLWKVTNADKKIEDAEIKIINDIGMSLGLSKVEFKENIDSSLDEFESAYTLRELYRISISDKDLSTPEKAVINEFIGKYKINNKVVEITEQWAKTYLSNENLYYKEINNILS